MHDGRDDVRGLDDLLGAYALDAVDPDERARIEEYLAIDPRAAAEVAEHREVASMLAFTGMDAPDGVWARIENELGAKDVPPPPGPELARVLALEPREPNGERITRRRWASAAPWAFAAAAATLIAVAGSLVVIDSRDAPGDPLESAYEAARSDRDSVSAVLVAAGVEESALGVIDQDGHGYLEAAALPTLPDDRTYQLWGVLADTGDVVSLGILGPNPELETFTVEGRVDALAITIENSPGVISDGNPDGAYVGTLG